MPKHHTEENASPLEQAEQSFKRLCIRPSTSLIPYSPPKEEEELSVDTKEDDPIRIPTTAPAWSAVDFAETILQNHPETFLASVIRQQTKESKQSTALTLYVPMEQVINEAYQMEMDAQMDID